MADLYAGQVIAVAGGGAGIGRQYCLDLAGEGAHVLVSGRGESILAVVDEIRAAGGTAEALIADVREGQAIVDATIRHFGRIDGLIVNAGILHDRSFLKMAQEEWDEVLSVHLEGTHACVRAAWPHMMEQRYGRIVLTTSGAAIYGNFGQANYSAAKGGIIGFAQTLAVEGASRNVFVNVIAPSAASALSRSVFSEELTAAMPPQGVSPFVVAMMHPNSQENGALIEAGGGFAAKYRWQRSQGRRFSGADLNARTVLDHWDEIVSFEGENSYPGTPYDSLSAFVGPDLAATFLPVAAHGRGNA